MGKYRSLLVFALLFLPMICSAQVQWTDNYAASLSTQGWSNNIPNCMVGQHDCWHASPQSLAQITSGGGLTGGLRADGEICLYSDYPSNLWNCNTPMGGYFRELAICSPQQIYALSTNAVSGGYQGLQWNGSAWTNFGGGFTQLSCAADGTIAAINSFNEVIYVTASGAWTGIYNAPVTFVECTISAQAQLLLCVGSSQLWQYDFSANTWTSIANASHASIGPAGNVYKIDTGGNAWEMIDGLSGWSYAQLAGGPFTSIANAGSMEIWALGPSQSGANVWRFPDQALTLTATLTGSTTCNGGCPSGSMHIPQIAAFHFLSHSLGGGTNTCPAVSPTTNVNCQQSDTIYDPFFCFEGGTECSTIGTASIQCTVMGVIFSAPVGSSGNGGGEYHIQHEIAYSKVKALGGPDSKWGCFTYPITKITTCKYNVTSWCSNTASPDFNPAYVSDGEWFPYWKGLAACIRLTLNNVPVENWNCALNAVLGTSDSTKSPFCDYNPY